MNMTIRKATVTKVVSDSSTEASRYQTGYVIVVDETDTTHHLINDSPNQVSPEFRKEGVTGKIQYIASATMALWYFTPDT